MKKEGFLAGALALALLAGCSAGPELTADPDDIAYLATGIQRDRELVTVDGEPILAEDYLFWLARTIDMVEQYGLIADETSWDEPFDEDMTLAQAVKADALETAKLYRVVETKAGEYGVELTEEQQAQIEADMDTAIEAAGGEEQFQARLDEMCISREGFTRMNRVYYLHDGLKSKMEELGELDITAEEREAFTQEFIEENGIYAAKHILISTRRISEDGSSYEEYSPEEKEAAYQLALELRQQLRDAGDSEETFDELMAQYSEDGRDEEGNLYAPDGYGLVYTGEMVSEFEEGALALRVGEIGEPVETGYGYHIILRTDIDREALEEETGAYFDQDYKLQRFLDQWVEEAVVVTTDAYDSLEPQTFEERLTQVNQERSAPEESQEPEETGPAE